MAIPESIRTESRIAAMECLESEVVDRLGKRSTLTCPECHGVLWEMNDGKVLRYRCHVGHAVTSETLSTNQEEEVEKALWIALRTLEESATLARRMAERAKGENEQFSRKLLDERARQAEHQAATIRGILMKL
jgi:two-component system chemotaxis response regulator CheB